MVVDLSCVTALGCKEEDESDTVGAPAGVVLQTHGLCGSDGPRRGLQRRPSRHLGRLLCQPTGRQSAHFF